MKRRGFVLSILSVGVLGASGITPLVGALPRAERAELPIKWSKVELLPDPSNFGHVVRGWACCGTLVLTYALSVGDLAPGTLQAAAEETQRRIRQEFVNRGFVPQ